MSQKFVLRAYVSYSREEPTDVDNELCVMHARTHAWKDKRGIYQQTCDGASDAWIIGL